MKLTRNQQYLLGAVVIYYFYSSSGVSAGSPDRGIL